MAITGNSLELLVKLGINNGESKANLNAEIAKLQKQLSEVKINIKIDPNAIKSINQLANMDFSKLVSSANEVKKAMDGIQGQAKTAADLTEKEFKQSSKDIEKAFEHLGANFTKKVKQGIQGDIADLKEAFKGLNATFKLDYKMLQNKGAATAAREIDAVTVSYRNLQGQMEKMKMSKLNIGEGTNTRPVFVPVLDSKAIDSSMASIGKMTTVAKAQIEKLRIEGKLTEQQFFKLNLQINNAGRQSRTGAQATENFRQMNVKILEAIASTKRLNEAQKATEAAQRQLIANENKRKNLIIDIERAIRTQGKGYDVAGARALLEQTQRMNVASATFGQSLQANRTQLRQFSADAATASRSSVGMMDAFKQAMEKFPIWMAASTIFFGVTRSAREFSSIIVDIDTKMTTLTKVMSDNTDFEALFDRATESADRYAQSISEVMNSYAEFARQGYKDMELGTLADAGLVASNVGEITAQEASEYMTASLIQWKKDANEAMGIIDSLVQ